MSEDAPEHRRTAHPEDAETFAPGALPTLRRAVEEVCWLLGRGYPLSLAVRAAGDRHQLPLRARLALTRAAAGPQEVADRGARCVPGASLRGATLDVDLFNELITLELALGGGVLFACADGPLRDLAGMRGSYRIVRETAPAVELLLDQIAQMSLSRCAFCIDAPVSNSGRLRALLAERAAARGLDVAMEMVPDADAALRGRPVVASADAVVIDGSPRWCNLAREIVQARVPGAWVLPLGG
ncbi:MAG: DUF434 domain-containing protein [Polyangiales bacterium]